MIKKRGFVFIEYYPRFTSKDCVIPKQLQNLDFRQRQATEICRS